MEQGECGGVEVIIALIVAGWVGCGVLVYGFLLGDWQHRFPYMKHEEVIGAALFGPLALPTIILSGCKHWSLRHRTFEERWNYFLKTYDGILTREYFEERYR